MNVSRKVVKTTRASCRSRRGAGGAAAEASSWDGWVSFTGSRKPLRKVAEAREKEDALSRRENRYYFFDQVAPPSVPMESFAWPDLRHAMLASESS